MIRTANLTDTISRKAGGLHESVRRLVQSLADKDVEVRVLGVEDEFSELDRAVWAPVPLDLFPRSWPYSFGYSPCFLKVLEAYRPDLIHTHGIWLYPSIATTVYCTRQRVPYMISPHGMVDPWAIRHRRWKKVVAYALFESNHIRGARCVRALCDSEARSIRTMRLRNPIAVIPNGIDPPARASLDARAREDSVFEPFAKGRRVLLYLGRLHSKKNLSALLQAWSAQEKAFRGRWALAIAGWDQLGYEGELGRMKEELGIVDSVSFVGPKFGNDKAETYRNADAFILPSLSEGLPMVVLEAWAFAKPVLMTDACNLPEGFAAEAAIRVGTSANELQEGLRQLEAASDEDLRAMGERGRQLVEERFTWGRIAEQMKTTYEWMLGGGESPAWMYREA